ncbi:uncharacterized protein LOC133190243 [Saccostrea echinata]|uniref:uncharacterized protein LOC133190243 n=1 Tax=Saccostrea echinata TaxID=191078 RepID=UPI002A83F48B|nr:uncharacterized protein LOC133190243 [Saccostrea echinata]
MGTGASSSVPEGVTANPRLVHTESLSKRDHKQYKLDTPVLIDVEHGSVRYRYGRYEGEPADKTRRVERPFKGEDKVGKQNYFYHARLNDFSEKSNATLEDQHKFRMVTQGPARAKDKKVFYVYSIGWNKNTDGKRVMPSMSKEEGKDYAWPQIRKPNEVYYDLSFNKEAREGAEDTLEEDRLQQNLSSTANRQHIQLLLSDEDSVKEVRKYVAAKILKSACDIHVCYEKQELREEDVVGDLRKEEEGSSKTFCVDLLLI